MRKVCLVIIAALVSLSATSTELSTRFADRLSLNGTWDFQLNGGQWSKITVPGNWEMQGFDKPEYGKRLVKSEAVYKRTFTVPADWKGKAVTITFDGVNYGYSFAINGKQVGEFHGSYLRRSFDVSDIVNYGFDKLTNREAENSIEVKVQTQPRAYLFDVNDNWALSGISRPVYLTCKPKTHIEDCTIKTTTSHNPSQGGETWNVSLTTKVEGPDKAKCKVMAEILDADGKVVGTMQPQNPQLKTHYPLYTLNSKLNTWSAEHPYLYTMRMKLMKGKKVVETVDKKFGVRQVTWDGAVFKINGVAVKLKGVDHHDMSPVYGRAITEAEMLEDLKLMKAANCNAIRLSHYPPNERFLEMCDSMGMYCVDEVPYGFGDQWLGKQDYLKDLKERAYYTVLRDKNHPCVVVWSVGNENPVTKIGLETGRYVYSMDNTRPYVFPQTHKPFAKMFANTSTSTSSSTSSDSITMYSLHYPTPGELSKLARTTKYPIMHTEYAHALGLDFGSMQDVVETWYKYPQLAGGCVWMLADQGIIRKSDKPVDKKAYTPYVWLDANTYYDTDDDQGADGILYSDRKPQCDYYQVRKVYAPVVFKMQKYDNGIADLSVLNRFDFTDLKDVKAHWSLVVNNKEVKQGDIALAGAPHTMQTVKVEGISIPQDAIAWLAVNIKDTKGETLTEQNFRLDKLNTAQVAADLDVKSVQKLANQANIQQWIKDNVYARVGKKRTMSEVAAERVKVELWPRNIIPVSKCALKYSTKDSLVYHCVFDCDTIGYLEGTISVSHKSFNASKGFGISYALTPLYKGRNELDIVEAGLSIKTPDVTTARWIGQGPYACYPGKNKLDEFGVWQLNTDDIYFPGNRQDVSVMLLTDDKGAGIMMVPETTISSPQGGQEGAVALERYGDDIVVSHNMVVSQPYNKQNRPAYPTMNATNSIHGSFSLLYVNGNWSEKMQSILGAPTHKPVSYAPYYYSYDQ